MAKFFQELKALVWRNILLKKRKRGELFQDLFVPVYLIVIIAFVKKVIIQETIPSRTFPAHDINSTIFGQPFSAHTMIYAVPNTTKCNTWMQEVVSQLNGPPQYKLFGSEEDAESAFRINHKTVKFGVIFNNSGDPNAYTIRGSSDKIPSSKDIFDFQAGTCREDIIATSSKNCRVNSYLTSGFVQLQIAIENVLMANLGVPLNNISSRNTRVHMMDLQAFNPDSPVFRITSPIYFTLTFCYLASYLVVNIVSEKERNIKDGMLMMGLNSNVFLLSWFLIYLGMVIFSSTIMVIILVAVSFFRESNIFLLFMMFVLYGISFIALAFMVTPFFNKARVAGAVATSSSIFVSLLYLIVRNTRDQVSHDSDLPVSVQWLLCLLPPLAFATCIDKAIFLDIRGNGFGFDDSLTKGNFPLYVPLTMLVVDTIIYTLLTLYFDKVIPNEYGVRFKPYFFLEWSYWFPPKTDQKKKHFDKISRNTQNSLDIEPVPESLESQLSLKINPNKRKNQLKNLTQTGGKIKQLLVSSSTHLSKRISSISKSFKVNKRTAFVVKDFSLNIYKGHITCLLGHNGAGKTTLMNILTGVIPPTSGSASVMGLDITIPEQMVQIRKKCGICPQHSILFDILSCKEHLRIFADIKGVPVDKRESTVLQALKDVDLESQGDTFAEYLSGGQKRKLSVAIALIGDPELIFLDEPTAGMDPYSRRNLWSLLKERKDGRVVLLTTQFMDEADILSDRKAFIQKGELRCCGSSLYLKNRFGIGYHLTMMIESYCNIGELTTFLISIIPQIKLQRSHGQEVAYTVPLSDMSKFSELFGKLDESSCFLGIRSYGVSMTTLEEVFLKLERLYQNDDALDSEDLDPRKNDEITFRLNDMTKEKVFFTSDVLKDGMELQQQQFVILLWIRFLALIRNKNATILQIFLPLSSAIAGLIMVKKEPIRTHFVTTSHPISLNYYVNSAVGSIGLSLPGLLAFDLLNTSESINQISEWETRYVVDCYAYINMSSSRPYYVGVQLNEMSGELLTDFVILYNHTALHSIPAVVSLVTNSLLNASGIAANVTVSSHPWPQVKPKIGFGLNTLVASFFIGFAFILIIPGLSTEVVRDRECNLRNQLRISGVGFNVYWGTIYVMSIAIYIIPGLLIILIVHALQIPGLNSSGAIIALLLLFLFNVTFLCFFALVISFLFNSADSCSSYLPRLLELASLLPYTTIVFLDMANKTNIAIVSHYIMCFIDPPYIIFGGFYFIARVQLFATLSGKEVDNASYFDPHNHTLIAIIMPIVHMVWMYWLLRILDFMKTGGKVRHAFPFLSKSGELSTIPNIDIIDDEDSDVQKERSRIDALSFIGSESDDLSLPSIYALNEDDSDVCPRQPSQIEGLSTNDSGSSSSNKDSDVFGHKISNKEIIDFGHTHSLPSLEEAQLLQQKIPLAYTKNLRKTFRRRVERKSCFQPGKKKTNVAVRNISLGVNEGDVLGLLGPNGAGKTTFLNMLIAETKPTCGWVIVGGQDIRNNMMNMAFLGYCPQNNALWDRITLREHIICFAAVKGVQPKEAEHLLDFYMSNMKLEEHMLKQAQTLSGGTKRKLSYILSILGNPYLVLMDEPSTGMDPQSKRFLWDTISATFHDTNRGAILTTHYMEEADALCNRVGIMVNGHLQCLGSIQHLKEKFGSGYTLEVKLSYNKLLNVEESMNRLEGHLREIFPDMEQVERFMERAQYAIPKENISSLGTVFASLEICKQSYELEEYNFSQSSLEQVFLHFAKKQLDDTEEKIY